MEATGERRRKLTMVKALHTAVWLFFVACIVLIPVASALRRFFWAELLAGFVSVECVVLALNRGRCPLTDRASQYTDERSANFDIYLPEWLARNNKWIFGSLFAFDVVFLAW
ncbi:MAG: hypothetical protein SGI92_28415 [Bryobacteraceae bacterium]|nr:hypothetical protein [Bryobacteraceae bacterium]